MRALERGDAMHRHSHPVRIAWHWFFDPKEVGMYGELAKYRIDDLVREADAYRMTRSTRLARGAERRAKLRRIGSTMSWVVTWPIKH
jgi:hypothetical protein